MTLWKGYNFWSKTCFSWCANIIYDGVQSLLAASGEASLADETVVRMVALFDHEEVGSDSAQGAGYNALNI